MFLPIGDAPNPKGVPFVTYALIAANVAVVPAVQPPARVEARQRPRPRVPRVRGGDVARAARAAPTLRQIVAADERLRPVLVRARLPSECAAARVPAELHVPARGLHAPLREHALPVDLRRQRRAPARRRSRTSSGTSRPAIAATLTHSLVFSASDVPLVGASGAISGVLGFYFVFFPRNTVRLLAFLPPFLMQVFEVPARWVLGMYLVARQPPALPALGRGRRRARRAHRRLRRRGDRGVGDGPARPRGATGADVEAPEPPTARATRCEPPRRAATTADAARHYFALPPAPTRGARLARRRRSRSPAWLREQRQPRRRAHVAAARRARRAARRPASAEALRPRRQRSCSRTAASPPPPTSTCSARSSSAPRPRPRPRCAGSWPAIDDLQKRRVGQLRRPAW